MSTEDVVIAISLYDGGDSTVFNSQWYRTYIQRGAAAHHILRWVVVGCSILTHENILTSGDIILVDKLFINEYYNL